MTDNIMANYDEILLEIKEALSPEELKIVLQKIRFLFPQEAKDVKHNAKNVSNTTTTSED
jgi:hypothetical protein